MIPPGLVLALALQTPAATSLSPLPPLPPDPTNRFADDPRAALLGQRLFFEPRLSGDGTYSCATCHDPAHGFADGRVLPKLRTKTSTITNHIAAGAPASVRHVPTLWNVAYQRWLFWDGRADSLWAQALQPIENPLEMAGDRRRCVELLCDDPMLRAAYEDLYGPLPPLPPVPPTTTRSDASIDRVFANVGKALAAFERRLVSRAAPFDRYVEGVRSGDPAQLAALSPAARRGLDLFLGRGRCVVCHAGANLSDGDFHDVRLPVQGGGEPTDAGRYAGIEKLRLDPFNARSVFSDAPTGTAALELIRLARTPDQWGSFRTPTLRNVARTAPYMHDGRFATLRDVLHWYSTLEGARPPGHHGGETILQPLLLSDAEVDELLVFFESLTDEAIDPRLLAPP